MESSYHRSFDQRFRDGQLEETTAQAQAITELVQLSTSTLLVRSAEREKIF